MCSQYNTQVMILMNFNDIKTRSGKLVTTHTVDQLSTKFSAL